MERRGNPTPSHLDYKIIRRQNRSITYSIYFTVPCDIWEGADSRYRKRKSSIFNEEKEQRMKKLKILLLLTLLLSSIGCSVLKSPTSWNAMPPVLDVNQAQYKAIVNAHDMEGLKNAGNSVRTTIQELISVNRLNLDRSSGGNYGAGLLASAAALSSVHSDVLLGAGFLGATHVALSQRLPPAEYMQLLQNSSNTFYCLNQATKALSDSAIKANSTKLTVGFSAMDDLNLLGFTDNVDGYYASGVDSAREAYLRALEISQNNLDAKISLTSPLDIQNQLVSSAREASGVTQNIQDASADSTIKEFLVKKEELETELLACLALL